MEDTVHEPYAKRLLRAWHGYSPISADEVTERNPAVHNPDSFSTKLSAAKATKRNPYVISLASVLTILLYTWLVRESVLYALDDKACAERISTWCMLQFLVLMRMESNFGTAPAWEAVEYEDQHWKAKFTQGSIYRGPRSPELDQAWEYLWKVGGPVVPKDKLGALDFTPDQKNWTKVPRVAGGGFASFLELHCVDILRMKSWGNVYDDYEEFNGDPHIVRTHIDHCIEMLRISAMCNGDVTPILSEIVPQQNVPFADFSTRHKCRNYKKIREWNQANAWEAKLPSDVDYYYMVSPEGQAKAWE
ncbi:hypothetical protein MMC25_002838 [Agyrium rufum]|nr:hypothetical protein [Agyrium rufum]